MVSKVMEKDGPGIWHSIHVTAAWADNPEKVAFFNKWIRIIRENLKCEACRGHMGKYLDSHPPERAPDPFIWSWEFHNAVNRRLGKPEMEYNTAKKMYLDGDVKNCTEGCKDEEEFNSIKQGQVAKTSTESSGGTQSRSSVRVNDNFNYRQARRRRT